MLCRHCREQIEVGEACVTEGVNGHTRYSHVGCFYAAQREQEADASVDEELERVANVARTVH